MMKSLNKLLLSLCTLGITATAQASLVNFQELADGPIVGESAWNSFNTTSNAGSAGAGNIDITATGPTQTPYVYFDSDKAGVGVCGQLTSGTTTGAKPNNKNNLCYNSSDDNVDRRGEALIFTFNEKTILNEVWFNTNHDTDYTLDGNTILMSMNGGAATAYTFSGSGSYPLGWLFNPYNLFSTNSFSAGDYLTFAFDDISTISTSFCNDMKTGEQFYISAIDVERSVPEPATAAMFGLGLAGIILMQRRRLTANARI